jgi:hypothetical protein
MDTAEIRRRVLTRVARRGRLPVPNASLVAAAPE